MIIGITKETSPFETRVALTPQTAQNFRKSGFEIMMEQHAGAKACFTDGEYAAQGVEIKASAAEVLTKCDIWLKISAPSIQEIKHLKNYSFVIGDLQNHQLAAYFAQLKARHITCYALNQLPRISRAQPFDILSSQNNLAGYQAVVRAAGLAAISFPLMITSAGTIIPAKVLVIGVGVAGLQAIATAKRLGAKVYAFDINPELKEPAQSAGAQFIDDFVPMLESFDIIITGAFSADKQAPLLITEEMFSRLHPRAVLIDMAAAYGGNIAKSVNHKTTRCHNCIIYASGNLAAEVPHTASLLAANNFYNFVTYLYSAQNDSLHIDFQDPLIASTLLTEG
ncbi:MAG: NAD(P)(+) transhydrogenase (Re/Si-specific) subunit alpha [Alphaproteobacteria bacterium]|nr:NAD(P)(+) transhydrogenase (Re/Si-specific) subunit alpha [Alphaproteobacteria bacterium]